MGMELESQRAPDAKLLKRSQGSEVTVDICRLAETSCADAIRALAAAKDNGR
jgi:hypothetical protein